MRHEPHPSRNEDEYFAKHDAELLQARRFQLDENRRNAERASHHMKCPKCGASLVEEKFHHLKIDICPDCKGTWLDAGEIQMLSHVKSNQLSRFIGALFGLK